MRQHSVGVLRHTGKLLPLHGLKACAFRLAKLWSELAEKVVPGEFSAVGGPKLGGLVLATASKLWVTCAVHLKLMLKGKKDYHPR